MTTRRWMLLLLLPILTGCASTYWTVMRDTAYYVTKGRTRAAVSSLESAVVYLQSSGNGQRPLLLDLERAMVELGQPGIHKQSRLVELSKRFTEDFETLTKDSRKLLAGSTIETNWLDNATDDWTRPYVLEEAELLTLNAVAAMQALIAGDDEACFRLASDAERLPNRFWRMARQDRLVDADRKCPESGASMFIRGVLRSCQASLHPDPGQRQEAWKEAMHDLKNAARSEQPGQDLRCSDPPGPDQATVWVLLLTDRLPERRLRPLTNPPPTRASDERIIQEIHRLERVEPSAAVIDQIIEASYTFELDAMPPQPPSDQRAPRSFQVEVGTKSEPGKADSQEAVLISDFASLASAYEGFSKQRRFLRIHARKLRQATAAALGKPQDGAQPQTRHFWWTMPGRLFATRMTVDAGAHWLSVRRWFRGRTQPHGKSKRDGRRVTLRPGETTVFLAYIPGKATPIRLVQR